MRQLETYELQKLFEKQGLGADRLQALIAVADRNDGRFDLEINPARGDLSRGNERAEQVFVTAMQLRTVRAGMTGGPGLVGI